MSDGFSPFCAEDVAALRVVRGHARHQPGCLPSDLETVDKVARYLDLIVSGHYTVVPAPPPKTREIL